jgi:hypothetical protein
LEVEGKEGNCAGIDFSSCDSNVMYEVEMKYLVQVFESREFKEEESVTDI